MQRIYTLLIALGTSLIFAYLVTELDVRVFGGDAFSLFVTACIVLFVTYLLGFARGSRTPNDESSPDA
ncbi:MAG: hypothetical protein OXF31_04335 [Gammaproteobacteria bacterium]|nr:hypothetical protein [Gammaproteobacteria bacterium]